MHNVILNRNSCFKELKNDWGAEIIMVRYEMTDIKNLTFVQTGSGFIKKRL